MPRPPFSVWCLFLALSVLLEGPATALAGDEDEEEPADTGARPTLRAGALSGGIKLDGMLHDPAWSAAADSIVDLVTIEPEEGGTPNAPTIIKVLANESEIVVGAWCYDNDPGNIVSYSMARDSELDEEDNILIVLDTFRDGRSGYVFAVNANGARFDGLVIQQGDDVNSDWDAIWEAKTSRDDRGWYAEMRIPIKSLSFKKGLDAWGFNVERRVERLQESSRWSGAKRDYEIYQTSRAGLLTELPNFDFGAGLSVRPATVGRVGKPGSGEKADYDGDLSLDVTQRLGPNLLSSLTVNTDFAETEVDVRQINLTRFPVFFPEKRTFFLQGADIFDFGLGLGEETLVPFFGRRIGLIGLSEDDQAEIPINAGAKINGRIGNTNLGALAVNTRKADGLDAGNDVTLDVPRTTMGSLRVRQNVLEESSLGLIANFGDQRDRSKSWLGGVDFTYQTSNFMDEKNFLVGIWGLLNDREDLDGDKSAYGLKVAYPNDLWDVSFSSVRIGDGFDPSLGFVRRNDIHLWDLSAEFAPRPNWSAVRQMSHALAFRLFNDRSNSDWESYEATIKPFDWLFESGDRLEFTLAPQGDRPSEDFEVSDGVDIAPGSYEWTRFAAGGRTAEKRQVSGEVRWESGRYYDGDLETIEARLSVKPSALLTLELTGERNTGKVMALIDDFEELGSMELVEKDFTEELYGIRLQLNVSPDLQLSSLTQYDTQSRELGSNNRLRWTFDPLGDLFVVYNHNMMRNEADRWKFVSNQLPIKIQYTRRF